MSKSKQKFLWAFISTVVCGCISLSSFADYAVPLPPAADGTSIWTGGDADAPTVWSELSNWDNKKPPVWNYSRGYGWYWAEFANVTSSIVISLGTKLHDPNNSESECDYGAWGVKIDSSCSAQISIGSSDDAANNKTFNIFTVAGWGDSARGSAFVNYSNYPLIFNVKVNMYGGRSGTSGVLPGAIYNRGFSYTGTAGPMAFFAGDVTRTDQMNTSVFKAALTSTKAVTIEANHIVKLEGTSSSMEAAEVAVAGTLEVDGGTLTCGSLSTAGSGVVKLNNATFAPGSNIAGVNFEISGVVTINNGANTVDLSNATFAEGAMIKRGGTGAITLPEGVDCFVPTYSASCQGNWNVSESRWTGLDGDNPARWDVEGNWDSKIPIWGMDLNDGQYGQFPWYWAIFSLNGTDAIELGKPITFSKDSTEYTRDTSAYCLVVEAGSKQLKINQSPDSGAVSTLKFFPAGSGYTSFANYSAYPVIYNVKVSLQGASRDGASGVLPYAIYNSDFNFGRDTTLAFYAGDASLSEVRNTSTFNGAISATSADISIEANHIVVAKGALAAKNVTVSGKLVVDGGTVDVTSLATADDGKIVLKGATVTAETLPDGTTIGAGLTMLNYGDADITLGDIVFAEGEGGMLKLNGTGTVTLADSTVVPAGTLLVGTDATLSYTGGNFNLNYPVHGMGEGTLTVSLDSGRSLTLSSAVSGSVSLDCTAASSLSFADGFEWTSAGTLTLPEGTEVQGPFTWMIKRAGRGENFTEGQYWSDDGAIESGSSKTYLDYGYTARTVNYADNNYEYEFPSAATLVLAGKSSSSVASLEPKASKITIAKLIMGAYSQLQFSGGGPGSNGDEELYGDVTVASSDSAPAKFLSCDNRHDKIYAQLSGRGKIIFEKNGASGQTTLAGDNSRFFGTMQIDDGIRVNVSAANNLGGSGSSLVLAGGTLGITSGITYGSETEAITVSEASTLSVGSGSSVTIAAPISGSADLTITSSDGTDVTVTLSGDNSDFSGKIVVGSKVTLKVSEPKNMGTGGLELAGGTLISTPGNITLGSSTNPFGLFVSADSRIGTSEYSHWIVIYGDVTFGEGVKLAKYVRGSLRFPDASLAAFTGHLTEFKAKLTTNGVELNSTYTDDTIDVQTGIANITISANDPLVAWLSRNCQSLDTAAGVLEANTYLQTMGEADIMTGLEAYMLGYDARPTVKPKFTVSIDKDGFVFTFDEKTPKEIQGINLVYKMESSDDPAFREGTVETKLTDRKMSPGKTKMYNRLKAEITKAQ